MEHGTLTSYISGGCRCELCRNSNRDHQREHRKRKKEGTLRKKKEVKPKKPAVRRFEGNPITPCDGWEVLGDLCIDGVLWSVAKRDANAAGWHMVKVAVQGTAERKGNYWVQWNGERMAHGSDWKALLKRPDLAAKVVGFLEM